MALARRLQGVYDRYDARRQRDKAEALQAEDRQRQQDEDEIRRIAMMSGMADAGIVRGDDREQTVTPDLPNFGDPTGMTQLPGMDVTQSRYRSLGKAGGQEYFKDKAREIAARRTAAEREQFERMMKVAQMRKLQAETAKLMQPDEPKPETPVNWETKETADGFVQVNPRTGEQRPLQGMRPKPRPDDTPKPADFEKKAAFMIEGAERANEVLSSYRPTARSFVSKVPGLGNYGISGEEQTALQAAATLHDAYLRLTTGATIAPSELEAAARQYIPQPGDKPDVIRAKAQRRAEIIRAIRAAAQPALRQQQRAGSAPTGGGFQVPFPEGQP